MAKMKHKLLSGEQAKLIREWAEAYRLWNEQEWARRRALAGHRSMEEKMDTFFDLCEAVLQIAPPKSMALYQAQWRAHAVVQERIRRFEERRAHGESST